MRYIRMLRNGLRDFVRSFHRKVLARLDWGSFRRLKPFCDQYGGYRGQEIDRYYIEKFLAKNESCVRGAVLEIQCPSYTLKYGREKAVKTDVLDINPANQKATVIADLSKAVQIKDGTYDCFILTQTLQYIYDIKAAIYHSHRILKPGGVILATVPCLSRIDAEIGVDGDYWRFTKASVKKLFLEFFPEGNIEIEAYGNVLTGVSFFMGLASEELDQKEMDYYDKHFPLLISVKAVKP